MTRYTDRIVNHMVSHMVKRAKEVLNKYVSVTITDMTDLIPEMMYYIRWAEYISADRLWADICRERGKRLKYRKNGTKY